MLKSIPKTLIYLAILFAFLSSLRISILPELQLLIFIVYYIKNRGVNYNVLILVVLILCTHHYAIPDSVYRQDSGGYPSIYTKNVLGSSIKIFDFFVFFLFLFSIKRIRYALNLFKISAIPVILLFTSFFGFLNYTQLHFADGLVLYLIRSYMLILAIFVNCVNLKKEQVACLSIIAIIAWISKMAFAILIPHPHPWYRTILGMEGIMFFAGDEYMYIPVYLSIIIYTFKDRIHFKQIRNVIFLVLLLALIAQRKGSLQILLPFLFLMFFYYRKNKFFTYVLKIYYILNSIILFFFLLFQNDLISNELINLAFLEYHTLAESSLDSVYTLARESLWNFFWGITPVGKIEIVNLPSFVDTFMTFGEEVGEKYRYQLWTFPFGRCFPNAGLFGVIAYFVYYIKCVKFSAPLFFVVISTFIFCIYGNITPVNALSVGISLAFIYINQKQIQVHVKNKESIVSIDNK